MDNNASKKKQEKEKEKTQSTKTKTTTTTATATKTTTTKNNTLLKPIAYNFKPDNHFKNYIDEFFPQEFINSVLPTGEKQ